VLEGRLTSLQPDSIEQDRHEALQLRAREENRTVITQVASAESKEIIDKVGRSLAVLARGQDLDSVRADKVKGLQEKCMVLTVS